MPVVVDHARHLAAERVDLLDQVALARRRRSPGCTTSARPCRGCRSAEHARAHARRGERGLAAGVAGADDDHVVAIGVLVHAPWVARSGDLRAVPFERRWACTPSSAPDARKAAERRLALLAEVLAGLAVVATRAHAHGALRIAEAIAPARGPPGTHASPIRGAAPARVALRIARAVEAALGARRRTRRRCSFGGSHTCVVRLQWRPAYASHNSILAAAAD